MQTSTRLWYPTPGINQTWMVFAEAWLGELARALGVHVPLTQQPAARHRVGIAGAAVLAAAGGGAVYVGSDDTNVYAIDAKSGKGIHTYKTGGEIVSRPLILNGAIFVTALDGFVYAFTRS